MRKCSCGCDMDIVRQCHACSFNDGRKRGALEVYAKLEGLKHYIKETLKEKNTKQQLECSLEYILKELEECE